MAQLCAAVAKISIAAIIRQINTICAEYLYRLSIVLSFKVSTPFDFSQGVDPALMKSHEPGRNCFAWSVTNKYSCFLPHSQNVFSAIPVYSGRRVRIFQMRPRQYFLTVASRQPRRNGAMRGGLELAAMTSDKIVRLALFLGLTIPAHMMILFRVRE